MKSWKSDDFASKWTKSLKEGLKILPKSKKFVKLCLEVDFGVKESSWILKNPLISKRTHVSSQNTAVKNNVNFRNFRFFGLKIQILYYNMYVICQNSTFGLDRTFFEKFAQAWQRHFCLTKNSRIVPRTIPSPHVLIYIMHFMQRIEINMCCGGNTLGPI